jgi:hypothetical protein
MKRIFYGLNDRLETQEREMPLDHAFEKMDSYLHYLKDKYDSVEQAVAASMFGFTHENQNNFIEINLDSKEEFRIKLEFQIPKKWLIFKWHGLYQLERNIHDFDGLKNLVRSFYEKDIFAFQKDFEAA